jgi:hypothetical protein
MENISQKKFTRIKGLSEVRRLPRLGKIRLGIKRVNEAGKTYPHETDYFVCPPEVVEVYGEQPRELEIMFPVSDVDIVFPQRLAWFGSSKGVKCMGDGETAIRIEEPDGSRHPDWIEVPCPCKLFENGCSRRAHLLVMLPKVSMGGVYQIDIESYNSIININSSLDYISALIGKFSLLPLKLKRIPMETHGSGRKEIHYILNIHFEGDIDYVNQLREGSKVLALPQYAVPEAEIENPAFDDAPTEEEAAQALHEAGMVPSSPPTERTDDQKKNDAHIMNDVSKVVAKAINERELIKWFNEFKKTPGLSAIVISEATRLVNEKMSRIRTSKNN